MQDKVYNTGKTKKEWITIALHALIWGTVFLIPYIFNANLEGGPHKPDNGRHEFLRLITAMNFFWLVLFYVNIALLLPRLVYQRKTGLYILTLAGIFCITIGIDNFLFHLFIHDHPFSVFGSVKHNFIPFVFTIAVSTAYKAITDRNKADMLIREKQSENLKTELSFLRSQVSPHFIFNVLNNIVALVRLKSSELEPTILKLSSLMQYMLYETDEEKVVLKNEEEYLQNYIDLQKQRFGPELSLHTDFDVQEEWQTIEPMLLIPFVENAFKHGNGLVHCPQIEIKLKANDNHLHFMVKNKFAQLESVKDKTSGIGLQNVKRRLELLYPGKHILSIDKKDGWFTIYLHLMLN
ncbi:MAG TPA: histidine kinase [Flavisolibacter sp.]|nr:histidine kinase [Flavisolibacter sp.]